MRLAIFTPLNWQLEIAGALSNLGFQIRINTVDEGCDVILNWSVTSMKETWEAIEKFPHLPVGVYNWDTYHWQHDTPREGEYDWKRFGDLLRKAKVVWCPSACTIQAMKEIYGVDGKVLKTYVPLHHLEDLSVGDSGYVFHAMRDYPDLHINDLKEVCEELNIPLIRSNQVMSLQEYRQAIAHCSFIVSHYKEASTGGLSLVEAAMLGKPCLVSDSPYHGGREYVGEWAQSFHYGDKQDLKEKVWALWQDHHKEGKFTPVQSLTSMAWEYYESLHHDFT